MSAEAIATGRWIRRSAEVAMKTKALMPAKRSAVHRLPADANPGMSTTDDQTMSARCRPARYRVGDGMSEELSGHRPQRIRRLAAAEGCLIVSLKTFKRKRTPINGQRSTGNDQRTPIKVQRETYNEAHYFFTP